MGATNTVSGGNKKYFKLAEKKEMDKPTGILRFVQQEKVDGSWQGTNEFKAMTGFIKGLEIKTYQYQGKDKETLNITMDDDAAPEEIIISLGFDTNLAKNILNTLAGETKLGVIALECGEPNIYEGKPYPTLWIKNDGQKTVWKYSKVNGNQEDVPKVTKTTDEDGNDIYKGKSLAATFWKTELAGINDKIKAQAPYEKAAAQPQVQPNDFVKAQESGSAMDRDTLPGVESEDDFDLLPF